MLLKGKLAKENLRKIAKERQIIKSLLNKIHEKKFGFR